MNESGLVEKIGYAFRDADLLRRALNHSSYVNEHNLSKFDSNERLEFLGDAMLEAFVSETLFSRLPETEEGELTKLRARIVCERSLFRCAENLRLGEYLNLGRGEEISGGRKRPSVLADALEALIGAIRLDGGREAAERFVARVLGPTVEEAVLGGAETDYKSRLQEKLQRRGHVSIRYEVEREEGPDHEKRFFVKVFEEGILIGKGEGRSKKQAEQRAAQNALEAYR